RMAVVIGDARIGHLIEEAKVDAAFDFALALRLEIRIAARAGAEQSAEAALRRLRGVAEAAAEAAAVQRGVGGVDGWLCARFAVGHARFGVAQVAALRVAFPEIRERPRGARLRIPRAWIRLAERREAVVAHRGGEEELMIEVRRHLAEVRLG